MARWRKLDAAEAALHGSSHYDLHDLPTVLRWITANAGVHHMHHLCSRIPYYRLPRVLRNYPELVPIGRLTLRVRAGSRCGMRGNTVWYRSATPEHRGEAPGRVNHAPWSVMHPFIDSHPARRTRGG